MINIYRKSLHYLRVVCYVEQLEEIGLNKQRAEERLEALTTVKMSIVVSSVVMLCSLGGGDIFL
jgi:hypothetical protein